MIESIATLFSGYGFIPMIIFAVGIVFIIIEIFVPGFGVFGILGSIFIALGIVVRFLLDFNLQHVVAMIAIVILFILLVITIVFYSAKSGLLGKSPLIENKTAVAKTIVDKKLLDLIGKRTTAKTNFTPAGRFVIGEEIFEAFSYGEFIEKGTSIEIVEVVSRTIYVRKSEYMDKEKKSRK